MRTLLCIALSGFSLMLPAGLAATPASRATEPAPGEKTPAQLLEFLGGAKDGEGVWQGTWRLNRHWVGTIKTVIATGHLNDHSDAAKDEPLDSTSSAIL